MIRSHIIGIDIGSVAIAIVETDHNKKIINHSYTFHQGDVEAVLQKELEKFDIRKVAHIGITSSTPEIIRADGKFNNQVAVIAAAKNLHPHFDAILFVGGEKFGLLNFDSNGNYSSYKTNTSCAAGTGSFLDQQSGRLNLTSIESLSSIAFSNPDGFPKIASRCAVFAKTDLIHAQQEGYTIGQISEGLCYGLAKNITDTLFTEKNRQKTVLFCGGVAKNSSVKDHIEALSGATLVVDDLAPLYGAAGAAFCIADEAKDTIPACQASDWSALFVAKKSEKKLFYPPLKLTLSDYPDFGSLSSYHFFSSESRGPDAPYVEVDLYEKPAENKTVNAWIGVDIGSTSTKAVLMDAAHNVLAGFYTRTAGNPLKAICLILESMDSLCNETEITLKIKGCATTGSGRKFIGKILGADTIVDEITAHARAAHALNPDVDTIIEIGGQDAKFTTLKNGMVTSSTMNNVCAAGTGSFIEEQARKLGCSIHDYAGRTDNVMAPMSSDRCTVFMERDLNHYLTEGYEVNEVLASVLHSVRDNYLIKVATESSIGGTVFFQGATAKNKALVAAFEQRLQKPILVSKFCHLTGAMGSALSLMDEQIKDTTGFRGLDIYKSQIPVRSEVCELCTNHCKIMVADIRGENVAYGFMCGRDYDTQHYVNEKSGTFDLLKARKRIEFPAATTQQPKQIPAASFLSFSDFDSFFKKRPKTTSPITMGIPAALHLSEDLAFWTVFFDMLGIKTITSQNYKDAVKRGKNLSETEFCAPATALYGHVEYLMDKADYIFVPGYLENKSKTGRRQYCYYTQYMPVLMKKFGRKKILTPLVQYLYTNFHSKLELYKMLKDIHPDAGFFDISTAYDKALDFKKECKANFHKLYNEEFSKTDDISVALLGRPYTVLSAGSNSGIPDIFSSLGIKPFFQDMITDPTRDTSEIAPLLEEIHWQYPAEILKAAHIIAKTPNLYPVYITSFKCTPDAFALTYFKKIMDKHEKPYLILELDEHDSSVGYETRIESAIRAFRNDQASQQIKEPASYSSLFFKNSKTLKGKNVVFPNWDEITCRFLTATLKREGINAYLIDETPATIQKSMKFNSGQCLPANAIAQGFVETIEKNRLDPANTVLWISKANFCNLKLYPNFIQSLLSDYGNGMEKAGVFCGQLTLIDISIRASINAYFSHMFGGMLRKMACKIRPYERLPGSTNQVLQYSISVLEKAFLGEMSKEKGVEKVTHAFQSVAVDKGCKQKPKVAVFGDLYVRDNNTMNQGLIEFIEQNGGQVVTTPYTEMGKMIAPMYYKKWFDEGLFFSIFSVKTLAKTMGILEKRYYKHFESVTGEPQHNYDENPDKILAKFNVMPENTGESMENILKVHYLIKHYPDLSLFVQTSPAFCCPSLVTEAMRNDIEKQTSVPIVSLTYDGTGGLKNDSVVPYLKFPRQSADKTVKTGLPSKGLTMTCL